MVTRRKYMPSYICSTVAVENKLKTYVENKKLNRQSQEQKKN